MSHIDDLIGALAPTGVRFVTLADVAETVPGLSGKTKADFSDGNARFVSYKNVFANLAVDQDVPDFVKVAEGEKQNRLQLGDVIFTGSSETADEVGMSSVVMTEPGPCPVILDTRNPARCWGSENPRDGKEELHGRVPAASGGLV